MAMHYSLKFVQACDQIWQHFGGIIKKDKNINPFCVTPKLCAYKKAARIFFSNAQVRNILRDTNKLCLR